MNLRSNQHLSFHYFSTITLHTSYQSIWRNGILVSSNAVPAPTAAPNAAFNGTADLAVFTVTSTRNEKAGLGECAPAFSTSSSPRAPPASWPSTSTRSMTSEILLA